MVDQREVDRFFPHADPAPWAGNTRTSSGSAISVRIDADSIRPSSSAVTPIGAALPAGQYRRLVLVDGVERFAIDTIVRAVRPA